LATAGNGGGRPDRPCRRVVSDVVIGSFWLRHALLASIVGSVIVVMLSVAVINEVIETRRRRRWRAWPNTSCSSLSGTPTNQYSHRAPGGLLPDVETEQLSLVWATCGSGTPAQSSALAWSRLASSSRLGYVFTRRAASWRQIAELSEPGAAADDLFGDSTAISGQLIVLGSPGQGSSDSGAAYIVRTLPT
jgi:FG-GAP repeat